jgi:invasion protein IalB
MAVSARFRVTRWTIYCPSDEVEQALEAGEQVTAEVEMTPDYAQGKNAAWASATPNGVIRLTINNPEALKQLRQGTSLAITFEPVEA